MRVGRKEMESFKTERRKLNLITGKGRMRVFKSLTMLLAGDQFKLLSLSVSK